MWWKRGKLKAGGCQESNPGLLTWAAASTLIMAGQPSALKTTGQASALMTTRQPSALTTTRQASALTTTGQASATRQASALTTTGKASALTTTRQPSVVAEHGTITILLDSILQMIILASRDYDRGYLHQQHLLVFLVPSLDLGGIYKLFWCKQWC